MIWRLMSNCWFSVLINGVPRGCPFISHLAYADDVLIFSSGTRSSLQILLDILKQYESCSGQRLNVSKSCFFTNHKLLLARRALIAQVTGFS